MIDRFAIIELEREKEIVIDLLPRLGKHKIEEFQRVISKHYVKRFAGKRRIPKYGGLNKGFTEEKLQAFFLTIDKPKYKLLFGFMAYLGLRIGEAVKVNVKDIDWQTREIRIRSEKTKVLDLLIIPLFLYQQTEEYAKENKQKIDEAQGYLFFQDRRFSKRQELYLESDYVRRIFRDYVVRAQLDETYDTSEESIDGRKNRNLHLLSSHSLRHYAITQFARQTNGNLLLTARFARHIEPSTTKIYIHFEKDELYREIDNTFSKKY